MTPAKSVTSLDMQGLDGFIAYAGVEQNQMPLPVETWNPPDCGDIDMVIARDGSWTYNGTPIRRPALVRLFARLLRRDPDRYVLVTPVEKLGITVEDVPFLAVEMNGLTVRSNVGDVVTIGASHPLRFETDDNAAFIPYVRIRGGLDARLSQSLAREVAERIEERDGMPGIAAADAFFAIPGGNSHTFPTS